MPRISRGIVLLCDQVWMAGAPLAARLSCWTASSFFVCKPVSWLFIAQGCRLSRAITPKVCSCVKCHTNGILCLTPDFSRSVSWKCK